MGMRVTKQFVLGPFLDMQQVCKRPPGAFALQARLMLPQRG